MSTKSQNMNEKDQINEEFLEEPEEFDQIEEENETEQLLIEQLNAQKELLLRTAAEYDNYRKRTERDKTLLYRDAVVSAVYEMLPVADSLHNAKEIFKDAEEVYKKGFDLVITQLNNCFEKLEVFSFGEVGDNFDPEEYSAISHTEGEEYGPNQVIEVFLKGYKTKDKVIRHAMVKVAN